MKTYTLLFLLATSVSCNSKQVKQISQSNPLFYLNDPKLLSFQPEIKQFEIDPLKDTILCLNDRGSTLKIQANSFLNSNGSVVNEKVNLSIKEFTNAAEIAFSGIPMTIQEDNDVRYFNSSGMFEIQGRSNFEKISIDSNKPLKLDYTLTQNVEKTDFYRLKDDGSNWNLVQKIPTLKETFAPIKISKSNNDRILKISFEDQTFYPEFKKYKNVRFQICKNVPFDTSIFNMLYYQVGLEKTNEYGKYLLILGGYDENASFITQKVFVNPILDKKEQALAYKKYEILFNQAEKEALTYIKEEEEKKEINRNKKIAAENAAYEKQLKFQAKLNERLIKNEELLLQRNTKEQPFVSPEFTSDPGHTYPAIVRELTIASFGIYNCDQIYRIENLISIEPHFVDENGNEIKNMHVLSIIDKNRKSAFSFHPSKFSCAKDGHVVLVLFTNDKEVYVLEKSEVQWQNFASKTQMTLKMKNETKNIRSSEDLRNFLKV